MSRMSNFFGRIVMSYPFYIHAATSLTASQHPCRLFFATASQHPCRLFFAAAAVAAPFVLISNSAYAALNCTTQPTCEQLGYSKSVDANCDDYILCPFDTSYKKCITGKVDCAELGFTQDDKSEWCNKIVTCQTDSSYTLCAATENCDDFPLNKCPTGASSCSSCSKDDDLKFKVDSCKSGYTYANDTCKANSCTGYTLTKCPDNGYCDDCLSGSTTKYKLTGCKDGFVQSSNSCRAKTCSDYGYTELDFGTRVCNNKISIKNGSTYITCYSSCYLCSSLYKGMLFFVSFQEACNYFKEHYNHPDVCLKRRSINTSGYKYGGCVTYEEDLDAFGAADCYPNTWCPSMY